MGLGIARRANPKQAGDSLTGARDDAHKARDQLRQRIDPIDQRDAETAKKRDADQAKKVELSRERMTLARAARDYHERVIEPSRTTKHAAQWIASLENHIPAALWHKPIAGIDAPELLTALCGVRSLDDDAIGVPETVQRVRQRLDAVFEDAIFHKRCTSNPAAAVRRKMREAQTRRERGQFAALPYREAPAFMTRLRAAEGIAARCLEFAVLTAARTTEALLAEWVEFDLEAALWQVPAARMKAKEAHTVHLSERAVAILKALQALKLDPRLVFPSPMLDGKALSNMAMLTLLGRMGMRDRTTVHGLCRSTFSTWANESGAARPDVIEAALAHEEKNKVRAAYNRAQFTEERRALLAAWAGYLAKPSAQVIPLQAA
jgi:integrase